MQGGGWVEEGSCEGWIKCMLLLDLPHPCPSPYPCNGRGVGGVFLVLSPISQGELHGPHCPRTASNKEHLPGMGEDHLSEDYIPSTHLAEDLRGGEMRGGVELVVGRGWSQRVGQSEIKRQGRSKG